MRTASWNRPVLCQTAFYAWRLLKAAPQICANDSARLSVRTRLKIAIHTFLASVQKSSKSTSRKYFSGSADLSQSTIDAISNYFWHTWRSRLAKSIKHKKQWICHHKSLFGYFEFKQSGLTPSEYRQLLKANQKHNRQKPPDIQQIFSAKKYQKDNWVIYMMAENR